ncbi:hypothetical protein DFJ67_1583 [Asanoa ferruginea]|uniref:Uncharacterized protein n=1 Tax=Asanoa ferruginea TaxID=53367 RepID=A0A3D9ZGK0_9ACTN|nr:hypothetical protein DFJ67_1583 [Asanoa ferruginea]GIF51985.1 hypothetical protein Afe04nite_65240 [Asanoa ferruginea]
MTNSRSWAGYLAAAWALSYGVVAAVWAVTGDGFPYGANNDDLMHPLRAVPVDTGAAVFAVVLLGAGVLALATASRQPARPPRPVRQAMLALGWAVVAALVILIPGAHILAVAGYTPMLLIGAPFGWPSEIDYGVIFNWTTANEVWAILGGLLLARALLTWQRRTAETGPGKIPGNWVTYVAAAIPAVYAVTRLAWAAGISLGTDIRMFEDSDAALAATGLGSFALVGTWLTIGLVRPWGERFPRWMIGLAGRRVPVWLATVPAAAVAVAVGGASASFLSDGPMLERIADLDVAVLPMVLWPLWSVTLLLAAYAYHRRRTAPGADQAATGSAAGIDARIASSTSVADSPKVASVKLASSTKGRSH